MIREDIHKILNECLDEGEAKKLYGQTSFIMHWQDGKVQQVTDEGWKRTWREVNASKPNVPGA